MSVCSCDNHMLARPCLQHHLLTCILLHQARRKVLSALAALWGVAADQVEQYMTLHKPALLLGDVTHVKVGRACLPLVGTISASSAAMMQAAKPEGNGTTGQVGSHCAFPAMLQSAITTTLCH